MTNYLGHELTEYGTKLAKDYEDDFISYKCYKCNNIIFSLISELKYFKFNSGKDDYFALVGNMNNLNWHYLTLTCEEEQIKNLLE